jgi:signal transduction histidine kinase
MRDISTGQVSSVGSESPTRRRTLAEQEMVNSLGWLITMRWSAGGAVVVTTFLATRVFGLDLPALGLYLLGLGILGYNAVLRGRLAHLGRTRPDATEAYAMLGRIQIGLDWLAMTVVTAMTGGVDSPATIFFLFHIAIAALLLPHAHAFQQIAVAPALLAVVTLLQYLEILPNTSIFGGPSRHQDVVFLVTSLVSFTVACYALAYFCLAISVRLRRREAEVSGLFESVRDTTATLDLETVLNQFVESATRVLDCKGAAIRLIDPTRGEVAFAAAYGLSEEYLGKVPVEFQRARLDQETLTGDALFVNDTSQDPRIWQPDRVRAEGIGAMLSVPLVGKKGPLGVLRAYGEEGHKFTEEDASFLALVAAHGAVAIENAQAYQLLEDLNRQKSKFARITTHELRAPAQVTESLLTALADGYAGVLNPQQADLVARAIRRVQLLQGLVNDLLDLAAGKADFRNAERRRVSLAASVVDVCGRFDPRAREKGIELQLDGPPAGLEVWGDPGDIDRILNNLVSNAVKYTPKGRVTVRLTEDHGTAVLTVSDTGIGIAPEALTHVFEEFFRAANAKQVEEAGTGLGLAIVKDLVERYAGQITVTSREGEGTTFTVRLPLVPAAVAHAV